ncbi:thiamine-phosphate kinase [Ornithinimicrobium pekingense]|uniref:Thiamine-monophosphate kinase n=1 Tax=Ornithinimicrobium pekingense TaxID=384677 RepID=A0ABQ2F652_9MICO|nr:thiamine-phosphate kinase [Ornithinimicrobium pekingense]GGK62748.1 thiamine-monophosphate kinase [Ornithinimicrobium pekingense]
MQQDGATLGGLGEEGVLGEVLDAYADLPAQDLLVGPGDDTGLLAVRTGAVLATTDTVVRDRDWRDDWSTAQDVGIKVVTQNLADLAAMGGRGTGVLVALVAPDSLPRAWVRGLTEGIAHAAGRAGVPVVGGDLSSTPGDTVMVAVTALGELDDGVGAPVLRSGARPGDLLAVSGPLGRSGAGLELLSSGRSTARDEQERALLDHHRRPLTDLGQGPAAARAGATSMIDVSDGLVRDGDRVARASGVRLVLDGAALDRLAAALVPAVDPEEALRQVLSGGEEHELLATFPAGADVPSGWTVLGEVVALGADAPADRPGVWCREERLDPAHGGWDHFGG